MAALFWLSAQTTLPGAELVWDKLAHAVAYATLGLLCLRASHEGLRAVRLRPTLLALALSLGYGLLDELHQAQVPGRFARVSDWFADAIGAGLALPLYGALGGLWRRWGSAGEGGR